MNGITAWMEKYLVPVAAKIGSQKHLVALRDSFIGMLPATLAGALAAMISAIVTTFPSAIQQMMLGATAFSKLAPEKVWTLANTPIIGDLNNISALVNQGTLTVIGLIFAFSWGYNLARAYGVNDLAGGIVSVATLFAGLPNQMLKFTETLGTGKAGVAATDKLNGVLGDQGLATWKPLFAAAHLDAGAYFTVIIMGAIAVIIYAKLMLADITIKMPESVPPAVAKAFLAIIPTIAALYIVGLIYYIIGKLTDDSVINLITKYIAQPFQILSQNIFSVLIVTLFVSVFWFFGLHGPNVLAPVLDGIWGPLGLNNQALYFQVHSSGIRDLVAKGAIDKAHAINGDYVNLWVRGSWDAFAWFGGSGGTITLVIAIILFSKRKDYKVVGRLGLAPGIFNINEPVLFGLPVVLNAIFFIPFAVAPLISVIIAYTATALHLVDPVVNAVPWVTPPIMNAFMATGFDWRAIVLTIINLAITFVIWTPFVIAANKLEEEELD
ncbi:PTS sugar transporter subunit IIC [Lactococcus taiwanensis]|jgi:PTS system cellobiose-specific IIC component|uniref:PTS sugar transporter subunit IIC n=1 Tax=Lactococcus taiwanensis TaxID=1151742 RepID=A0AA45KGT7_9LACT|nr:PTS sugar transporter subunit IIC [Lactococcus taiwanensis]QRZ10595.1 PTS sugar transporter subunit IIC [Lactococcus taiwanensis]QSE77032.1 PTS sugar transporter subunit IIC [Lactococcus taiwanensis]